MKHIPLKQILLLALSLLVLVGCQTTKGYYKGAMEEADNVIPLASDSTQMQNWKDLYVDIDYKLTPDHNRLQIDGLLKFADHPRLVLSAVDSFELKVFLLGQENRVLEYYDLRWVPRGSLDGEWPINKSIELPKGTVAISFGYEGKFLEDNSGGGSDSPTGLTVQKVWRLPKTSSL